MIFKNIVNVSILILLGTHVYSQRNEEDANNSFPKSYWGVSATPFLFQKNAANYVDKNNYQANFTSRLAGEALINHYYNFSSNSSFVFSLGFGAVSHKFHYEIPKDIFNAATGVNVSSNLREPIPIATSYVKTQGEIQLKSEKNKKKSWFGATGLALLYSVEGPSEYYAAVFLGSNSLNSIKYLHFDQNNNNHHKPWLNFHVSGGYEWVLNSKSLVQASLKLNYSPVKFVTGTYRFAIGNLPEVKGKYSISGSYIGVSVSYFYRTR
jgi:hypothetical protein